MIDGSSVRTHNPDMIGCRTSLFGIDGYLIPMSLDTCLGRRAKAVREPSFSLLVETRFKILDRRSSVIKPDTERKNEPFIAPSADSPKENQRKRRAASGLVGIIIVAVATFFLLYIWIVIYGLSASWLNSG
ncbi:MULTISPECIES: hypothetical protein [unclassified Rhizobium]|uniref:hypothetical protein n=1 Tax=unclassified Rhizobium TaxID=2613769 RepID=UPI00160B0500|nr:MULTISPECIES: hypothetical protein [unclassified Rhizobium]MBB3317640.1 hypothetical protein [Rhizobium sp. BK181]MBB3543361.1 hypothetical protein [Rhizobium sp. BK399]MCS3741627.1 hypothetical protein [Rhizobium sp. BK661]MCS4093650.1 hypothetical protein [Rhizobium sp. BK176]